MYSRVTTQAGLTYNMLRQKDNVSIQSIIPAYHPTQSLRPSLVSGPSQQRHLTVLTESNL